MPTQTEQQEQEFPTPPSREELNPAPPPPQATAQQPQQNKGGVSLLSIEGLVVLMWAILLDLAGIIMSALLPGLGIITTILGTCTVGVWAYFRGGGKSYKVKIKKFLKRGGITTAAEAVSVGMLPGWTILVLLTVKK